MRYGDLGFKNEPIGDFEGALNLTPGARKSESFFDSLFNKAKL